ncbi:MAG: endonuclease V [Chloroflexota bacterium]
MIACIDVDYRTNGDTQREFGVAACLTMETWTSSVPTSEHIAVIEPIEPYVPGQFYRRELPCILAVLEKIAPEHTPDAIIVDGYVWLPEQKKGLGMHLYEALETQIPVIGVAKKTFAGLDSSDDDAQKRVAMVYRGQSKKPLYVTAMGIPVVEAATHIESMHGDHRLPTLLKQVDQLCRRPLD